MLARSLSALTLWRLQQPWERIPFWRLRPGIAKRLEHGSCSGVKGFPLHSPHTDHKNSPTITVPPLWSSIQQRGALHRPLIFNTEPPPLLSLRSKVWNTHTRLQSTTTATKSVLKQGGIPGKRTLKGPRTKQPSRANLPAPEEASQLFKQLSEEKHLKLTLPFRTTGLHSQSFSVFRFLPYYFTDRNGSCTPRSFEIQAIDFTLSVCVALLYYVQCG